MSRESQPLGPVLSPFLDRADLPALGPGESGRAAVAALAGTGVEEAFAHASVADRGMAGWVIAGLLILHDGLEEAHGMVQPAQSGEGALWHAILHRREPDPSNAKYWFRRAGTHPVGKELAGRAREILVASDSGIDAASLVTGSAWDSFAFVDVCEACRDTRTADELACQKIQLEEMRLLLGHCYRAATRG